MKTHHTFDFQTADGRSISVLVNIDPELIAKALAQKAWNANMKKVSACGKGVVVEVVRYQTRDTLK